MASRLTHWITENAKSTRAFLKRVDSAQGIAAPIAEMHIAELPREAHKKGDHANTATTDEAARALLAPALQGHDMGLVSEAGMPAIADPGSSIVRAAHALGLPVVPLSGPMSLMLALAASGLNGQSFAFVGYVPQNAAAAHQAPARTGGAGHENRPNPIDDRNAVPQRGAAAGTCCKP